MRKNKGAISIFMIIVLFSSFVFGGFFIDASRILVARCMVKNAVYAAARSSLSYYDTALVSEYGLYAFKGGDAQANFEKYFRTNLTLAEDGNLNLFKFSMPEQGAVKVTASAPIIDQDTFMRQVMEYSKYRAPVNITTGVVEKVASIFTKKKLDATGEGVKAGNAFDDFKHNFKDLTQKAIDTVQSAVTEKMKTIGSDLINTVKSKMASDIKGWLDNQMKPINDSFTQVQNYIDQLEAEKNRYAQEAANATIAIDSANDNPDAQKTQPSGQDDPVTQAQNKIDQLTAALKAAQAKVDAVKQDLDNLGENYKTALAQLNDLKSQLQQAENVKSTDQNKIKQNNDLKQRFLNIDIYKDIVNEYINADDKTRAEMENTDYPTDGNNNIKDLFTAIKQNEELTADINTQNKKVQALNSQIAQKEIEIQSLEQQITAKSQELSQVKVDVDGNISVAGDNGGSKDLLNGFNVFDEITGKAGELVGELGKNMDGSAIIPEDDKANSDGWIGDKLKAIYDYFAKLVNLATHPEAFRDQMYLVDYIMDKCTFLTSHTDRNHYFEMGEVEYIIFGNKNQSANIIATVAAISTMRFVINFVDDFITSPDAEPISRAIAALAKAAFQTVTDVKDIVEGQGCPLCPSLSELNTKLTYSDHLRLLLLLKMNGIKNLQNTMNSTIVVMYQHPGLDELQTRISADVEVEVNMVVLPLLGLDIWNTIVQSESFRDGKYVIRDKVVLGY